MKLRPIPACALFGAIASLYGTGIALVPLATGLFRFDHLRFITDSQLAKVVGIQLRMADGLSVRMLATSAFAFSLFSAIAFLNRQATRRPPPQLDGGR
jgi:hypothetical protein